MSANWWADPMPPGWESKWDAGQRRYFFIDHSTRKTSWVDPRSPEGRHLVAAPRPAPKASPQTGYGMPMQPVKVPCSRCHVNQVPSHPKGQVCATCTAKAAQIKCSKCKRNVVSQRGDRCTECMMSFLVNHQETSFNDPESEEEDDVAGLFVRADEALFKKLKAAYPSAMDSHIRSALESNNNEERKACKDLEKRGYKKVSQKEVEAKHLLDKLKTKYPGCSSDLIKATILSCNCVEAATMSKLKELGFLTYQEKEQKEREEREAKSHRDEVERKVRQDFPNIDTDTIMLALESADYKEHLARGLLNDISRDVASAADAAAGAKATSAAAKPKNVFAPAAAPSTSKQTSAREVRKVTPSAAPEKATKRFTPHKPAMSKPGKTKPAPQIVSQPKAWSTKTSTLACGPNPSIVKGGQDSLLLQKYCDVAGPNGSLVNGPSCRVTGSKGSIGPDPSLVHGPSHHRQALSV